MRWSRTRPNISGVSTGIDASPSSTAPLCRLLQKRREELLGVDYLQVMPEIEPSMAQERLAR